MIAAKSLAAESKLQGNVVRLRGLPYSTTAAEVQEFLQPGCTLLNSTDSICLTFNSDGRPTGEAYVALADEESLRQALKKHKAMLGVRYIEVFASTRTEMMQATQPASMHSNNLSAKPLWLGELANSMQQSYAGPGVQYTDVDNLTASLSGTCTTADVDNRPTP